MSRVEGEDPRADVEFGRRILTGIFGVAFLAVYGGLMAIGAAWVLLWVVRVLPWP